MFPLDPHGSRRGTKSSGKALSHHSAPTTKIITVNELQVPFVLFTKRIDISKTRPAVSERFSNNSAPRLCLQPKFEYNDGKPGFESLTHLLKVEFLKIDGLLGLPGDLVVDGQHRRLASHELNLETGEEAKRARSSRGCPPLPSARRHVLCNYCTHGSNMFLARSSRQHLLTVGPERSTALEEGRTFAVSAPKTHPSCSLCRSGKTALQTGP